MEVDEILDHSDSSVRLDRIRASGPLLFNHEDNFHLGRVSEVSLERGKLYGTATFSTSTIGEEKWRDVQSGILTEASVRYRVYEYKQEKSSGGKVRLRAVDWEPIECSMVSCPRDLSVGVGRSTDGTTETDTIMRTLLDPMPAAGGGGITADIPDREHVRKEERAAIVKRNNEIRAAADRMAEIYPEQRESLRSMADGAIAKDSSVDNFNDELLRSIKNFRQAQITDSNIGMSEKEIGQYSLMRAIQNCIHTGKRSPGGFEGEVSQEVAKRDLHRQGEGFWIPADVMVGLGRGTSTRNTLQRDSNVTSATQGGNLVQTSLVTPVIEILRNRMVTARAGVQTLSGLSGNVAIPRQTGAATAYWVSEQGTLTKSTQTIDQVSVSPKRVGAWNNYSKQLLLQSSVDVENWLRDDLMKVLAIKIDYTILEGTGANTPTGILNTSGIGTVTFGAAATWAKVISFETEVATDNADMGSMAYVTTPATRGKWKGTVKVANTASFLWENSLPQAFMGPAPDYGVGNTVPGVVNGYAAYASKQISSDYVAFGNWSDAVLCVWGGLDVVVDPVTLAETATVKIVMNTFCDVAVRHAESFVWSTDSGAQ